MQLSPTRPPSAPTPAFAFGEFPVLTTARLRLRALLPADRDAVFAIRGDPEVQRHNADAMQREDEAAHFIESRALDYKARRGVFWGVTRLGEARVIGSVSLYHWNHRHQHAEIGYELARACWGQGLAAEAVQAVVGFAFERLLVHRVEAVTIADNLRSVRLLERLGFRLEGRRRDFLRQNDGAYLDSAIYGLLASEGR